MRLIKPEAKERPADYRDPPGVITRQQAILQRWKAEGRPITQPRVALSLAIARQATERHLDDTKWGKWMHCHWEALCRNRLMKSLGYYNLKRANAAQRRNRELRKGKVSPAALAENPYALPEKRVARSGHTI